MSTFDLTPEQADKFNRALKGEQVDLADDEVGTFNSILAMRAHGSKEASAFTKGTIADAITARNQKQKAAQVDMGMKSQFSEPINPQAGGMSPERPEVLDELRKPTSIYMRTSTGHTLNLGGHQFEHKDMPLWKEVLMLPRILETADQLHENVTSPLIRAGQKKLRTSLGYSQPGVDAMGQPTTDERAGDRYAQALKEGGSPVGQYLFAAGTQWLLGEPVLQNMPEDTVRKAVGDIEQVFRNSEVFQFSPAAYALRKLGGQEDQWDVSATAAAGTAALAQEGGKLPLFLLGPGKWLRATAEAKPVIGGGILGGTTAFRESFLDPAQKPSTAAKAGVAVGVGVPSVVITSGYATKWIGNLYDAASGKLMDSVFDDALHAANAEFSFERGVQDTMDAAKRAVNIESSPVIPSKNPFAPPPVQPKPGEGLFAMGKKGAPLQVPYKETFTPSLIMMDNNSVLAVKLHTDKPAEVVRLDMSVDGNMKKANKLIDNSNAEVEFLGNELDDVHPNIQQLKAELMGGPPKELPRIGSGVKAGGEGGTAAAAPRSAARMANQSTPLIVQSDPAGNVDIFRLSSAKARERALRNRGATLDGRSETGGGPIEFSMPDGTRRKGFFLGTTDGQNLVFSPGHERDRLPGFIDQVVEVNHMVARPRELSTEEIRRLSRAESLEVKDYKKRMAPGLNSYRDMQSTFNKYLDGLSPAEVSVMRPLLDPPKPIEQMLHDWSAGGRGQYNAAVEKAVMHVKLLFGVTKEQASTLLHIAHLRRMAQKNPEQAAALGKKAAKLMEAGEAFWKSGQVPHDAKLMRAGKPTPEVIPFKDKMTYTPRSPMTVDEGYARMMTGQSGHPIVEDARHLMLNDGRQVEVVLEETRGGGFGPRYSESNNWVMVRDQTGSVFKVRGQDIAGPLTPQPKLLTAGGEPPPTPGVKYYSEADSKLADDLAWVMRNQSGNERQFNVGLIVEQGRKDGIGEEALARMAKVASEAAADGSRTLAEPSWYGAGGSGMQPPPPPALPPAGAPPPPKRPETSHDIEEMPTVLAATRDRGFAERMAAAVFGNRYTAPKDIAMYINEVYGARAVEKRQAELLAAFQRVTGEKQLSEFSKAYLTVAEGRGSMDDLEAAFPDIMQKPMVKRMLNEAMLTRDLNEQKLIKHGIIPERMGDEDLIEYVSHVYARYTLQPGQWAEVVKKNRALYDEGVAYFTKQYSRGRADSTTAAEAKNKAIETVESLIGSMDAQRAFKRSGAGGKAPDSLKHRSLDELERQVLRGKVDNIDMEGVDLIRRLLGQNTDGFSAVAMTIARQQALIANARLWSDLYSTKPEFFSRDVFNAGRNLADEGWQRIPESKGMYGPAAGMYAHPDIYDSLVTQPNRVAEANRLLSSISSWVKGNKTSLGSTTTWNSNFFGNVVYSMLAGADPLSGQMPHFGRAIREIYGSWKDPFSKEGRAIDELRRLGLDVAGFGKTEMTGHHKQYAAELAKQFGIEDDRGSLRKFASWSWGLVTKARDAAAGGYDVNDRMWKLASYYALLEKGGLKADGTIDMTKAKRFLVGNARLDKAKMQRPPFSDGANDLPLLAQEDMANLIKREAVYRVTASFPDPTKVSYMVDAARKNVGVLAPFLTFKAEDARVWASLPLRVQRGERDLLWRGLGYATAFGGMMYGMNQLAHVNGISDDDMRAAYANLSKSQRGFRPFMLALPFRDSDGRVQFIDLSRYIGWAQYLQGVDMPTAGQTTSTQTAGQVATQLLVNAIKAPVEGSTTQHTVDDLMARLGAGDPAYASKLREDQKGYAAAVNFLWKDLGLLPSAGPQQMADLWGRMHQQGPYSEPLTAGQGAAAALGFTVTPSGEGTRVQAARSDAMQARELLKQQVSAGRDVFSTPRTPADLIKRATQPDSAQERARAAALEVVEKRKQQGAQMQMKSELNRKAGK